MSLCQFFSDTLKCDPEAYHCLVVDLNYFVSYFHFTAHITRRILMYVCNMSALICGVDAQTLVKKNQMEIYYMQDTE